MFGLLSNICFAEDKKQDDWQYVLSRNEVSYSVEMKSVNFAPGPTLLFWFAATDYNKNTLSMAYAAVNTAKREVKIEEYYIFDLKTKEQLFSTKKPSNWTPIEKDSPVEIVVTYIFQHHPETKDIKH
jgi:hypothetical protein